MVLTVFLHMARVFYHGAYKPPREFNWVIGVILLTLTLLLSFTGYLLPWDQLALWAVTVGTNMMGYTPVFGEPGALRAARRRRDRHRHAAALVRAPRADAPVRHRHLHGHPLLAGPQGRRHLRAAVGEEEQTMTEIPEHLLKRAQEAKAKAAAKAAARRRRRRRAERRPTRRRRRRRAKIPAHLLALAAARAGGGGAEAASGGVATQERRRRHGRGGPPAAGPPVAAGPEGHTQRLLTVVKAGSIQDVKADADRQGPHLAPPARGRVRRRAGRSPPSCSCSRPSSTPRC